MLELESRLFDEYKHLDAVCRDIFSCQNGVSEYIRQMEQIPPQIRSGIPSWENDYRALKRLRWLRNSIAHDTSSTDCNIGDIKYLEDFYNRILTQQDPLAILEKTRRNVQQFPVRKHSAAQQNAPSQNSHYKQNTDDRFYIDFFSIIALAVIILLIVFYFHN